MPIFDAHMHVGDFGPMMNVGIDTPGIAQLMREHDIDGGVVFAPDNAMTAECLESLPGVYGLVWSNPKAPGYLEEAARYLEHPRFRGIKLHPTLDGFHPNDPSVHPLMKLLRQHDLPVLIHCGHPVFSLPWSIEELIVEFPDVKVVLGHMGHGNVIYINGAIDVAVRNPNVYLETSGMPMHTKILEAVERVGPDRVMFGSDIPFHHPQVEIDRVLLAGLSPELLERVLSTNGRALFLGSLGD
jgi:predicted TIM-barrel fold metal-dependent hydrolase